MSRTTPLVGVFRFVSHQLLGLASTDHVRAGTRRRPAQAWLVEPLEGRIVPATILVTSLADAGAGTLRAAIQQANLDAARDTITFAPSVTGTISLSTALPDLSANMVIAGPGPSVLNMARSGADTLFTIFTVAAGADVTISGLTITGKEQSFGGGIVNNGTLTVSDCTITGNVIGSTRFGFNGSGIYNQGTLTVINSTFSGNTAVAGILGPGYGGGIYNAGTLTVIDSTFSGNTGGYGGGGIYNAGTLTVINSTFSGNTGGSGGGIYNAGTLTVIDSTIADNSSHDSGSGGGIFNMDTASIINSILADNEPGGNLVDGVVGSFVSLGHNLFSDTPDVPVAPTDLVNTDPLLAPLADNGGPTFTQALLPGSPAINAGVAVPGVTTDQRGVSRPQGTAPDIGAFELQLKVLGVVRHGVHYQPTTIVITFSLPMDATRAQNLANYSLVRVGPNNRFGAGHGRAIQIVSAKYDSDEQSVTLTPIHRLPLHATYRLTVFGSPPEGLTDTQGLFLAGAADGKPGTNYVATINAGLLVPPIRQSGGK